MKTPDTADGMSNIADDLAKRRRALSTTAFTGSLGLGTGPQTTTALGG